MDYSDSYLLSTGWLWLVGSLKINLNFLIDWMASFGPVTLYDITANGVFSTRPGIPIGFDISARLNISAEAKMMARFKGSIGARILHVKELAKAGVNFAVIGGIQGYLDIKPTIGARKNLGGEDIEYFIQGKMALASQLNLTPCLNLYFKASGIKKRTKKFGGKTYSFGGVGITGNAAYIFGSGEKPEFSFEKGSFERGNYRPTKFLAAFLKKKESEKSEEPPTGSFEEERREIPTEVTETKLEPGVMPDIPRGELRTAFSMESTPHSLMIKLGVPDPSHKRTRDDPILLMASGNFENLFLKIDDALKTLKERRDQLFTPENVDQQLERRITDLEDIRKAAESVKEAADELGLDPAQPSQTNIPGFKQLAEQIHLYGERYNVQDIDGALERRSLAPEPPDIVKPAFGSSKAQKHIEVQYLNFERIAGGTDPKEYPSGWGLIQLRRLSTPEKGKDHWVRMHLLTEILGGPGVKANLTPARNSLNSRFRDSVERPAYKALEKDPGKVIWYEVNLDYHTFSSYTDFIRELEMKWGIHEFDRKSRKWEKRKWGIRGKRTEDKESNVKEPPIGAKQKIDMNSAKRMIIVALNSDIIDESFGRIIEKEREVNGPFADLDELIAALRARQEGSSGRISNFDEKIKALEEARDLMTFD